MVYRACSFVHCSFSSLPHAGSLDCKFDVKLSSLVVPIVFLEAVVASASGPITFNKDIAPIVFEHCAACHRPGESGPFSLLCYSDVKKRARQIAEVTKRRYMPPWLPAGQANQFLEDRRLSSEQIGLFARWFEAGAPEGAPGDLPPLPQWTQGWQLGKPDLILEMPRKYALAAEGRDVYRNFVIPVSLLVARHAQTGASPRRADPSATDGETGNIEGPGRLVLHRNAANQYDGHPGLKFTQY
jgi:hypothetical protein